MKTNQLTGVALDWAVAESEALDWYIETRPTVCGPKPFVFEEHGEASCLFQPSIRWAHGGPIIEREGIELQCNTSALQAAAYKNANPDWFACLKFKRADHWHGPTPLIAAMRCYVASKLGDEVEIPTELTQGEDE